MYNTSYNRKAQHIFEEIKRRAAYKKTHHHPNVKMSTNHTTLGAAADERKARLAKLKSLKRKAPSDEISTPENPRRSASPPAAPNNPDVTALHLSGRNYDIETRGPKLGFEAPPTATLSKSTLEQQAAAIEQSAIEAEEAEKDKAEEIVDLFKLQPKKPNWDLKRDLDRKLEILNVRTDNAIAQLVRERIEGSKKLSRSKGDDVGADVGLDGVQLVEGLREREREDAEDARRDKEDEDLV